MFEALTTDLIDVATTRIFIRRAGQGLIPCHILQAQRVMSS